MSRIRPMRFLLNMTRLPSHGRAIAVFFRQRKATRGVPIVFLGGEPEKVEKARELLPDAVYLAWEDVSRLPCVIAEAESRSRATIKLISLRNTRVFRWQFSLGVQKRQSPGVDPGTGRRWSASGITK